MRVIVNAPSYNSWSAINGKVIEVSTKFYIDDEGNNHHTILKTDVSREAVLGTGMDWSIHYFKRGTLSINNKFMIIEKNTNKEALSLLKK